MGKSRINFDKLQMMGECDTCGLWTKVTKKNGHLFCSIHLKREEEKNANKMQSKRKEDFLRVLRKVTEGVNIS